MNTTSISCPNKDNKCDNPMFKDFIGKNVVIEMKPDSFEIISFNGLLEKVSGGYLCIKSFKKYRSTLRKYIDKYKSEEYFFIENPREYVYKDNESLIIPKENIKYIMVH